jgi:hypothetical protein
VSILDGLFGIRTVRQDGTAAKSRDELDFRGGVVVEDDIPNKRTRITVTPLVGLTVAALSSLVGTSTAQIAYAKGYDTGKTRGGGGFYWDPVSGLTHNGGTVVGTADSTGRWIRADAQEIDITHFGAVGDNSTDDTAAVRAAVTAVPSGGTLYIPDGVFKISSTISRTSNISIRGSGTLKRSGTWVGSLLDIHGADAAHPIDFVHVEGVRFDGGYAGVTTGTSATVVYDGATGVNELKIYYADEARVARCKFSNTNHRSLSFTSVSDVQVEKCRFLNGARSNGSNSLTTAYHVAAFYCRSFSVASCTFESNQTCYVGTNPDKQANAMGSPTAVSCTNCDYVSFVCNKSYNAGNFEIYEANKYAITTGNIFERCHLPEIKISNSQFFTADGNHIIDPQHEWGECILGGCYTRLTTYGCLRAVQANITITNNIVRNAKTENGAIFVLGAVYSATDLNTRISYQDTAPAGTFPSDGTTNRVRLSASWSGATTYALGRVVTDGSGHTWESLQAGNLNHALPSAGASNAYWGWIGNDVNGVYWYKDFDGTFTAINAGASALAGQAYLTARNANISGNTIDGFSQYGIRATTCNVLAVNSNTFLNCGTIDANGPTDASKAVVSIEEYVSAHVCNNRATMPSGTVPTYNGSARQMTGLVAWTVRAAALTTTVQGFERVGRLVCNDNDMQLTQSQAHVDMQSVDFAEVQNNNFSVIDFPSTSAVFLRARGLCNRAKIRNNSRVVVNTGVLPSASTELAALQPFFLQGDFGEARTLTGAYGSGNLFSAGLSRRVVSAASDYTTPNPVAMGFYKVGSEIWINGNESKIYQLITTEGFLGTTAAWDIATTYAFGVLVQDGSNNWWRSRAASNLGNAFPVAGSSNASWLWAGTGTAARNTATVPLT